MEAQQRHVMVLKTSSRYPKRLLDARNALRSGVHTFYDLESSGRAETAVTFSGGGGASSANDRRQGVVYDNRKKTRETRVDTQIAVHRLQNEAHQWHTGGATFPPT